MANTRNRCSPVIGPRSSSERSGVARTPVRQALFKLQQEGYVEVLFRSGWRVLPFDFDQFEQLCDLHQVHLARQGVVGANTGLLVQQACHFLHRRFQHRQTDRPH